MEDEDEEDDDEEEELEPARESSSDILTTLTRWKNRNVEISTV